MHCKDRVFSKIFGWLHIHTFDDALAGLEFEDFDSPKFYSLDAPKQSITDQIINYFDAGEPFNLPLKLFGTEFQIKVWEALHQIPRGKLVTYKEIAETIGRPQAFRAVGTACKANPIAVIIPCHRVIRSDGELGNYRWGNDKKAILLKREGVL